MRNLNVRELFPFYKLTESVKNTFDPEKLMVVARFLANTPNNFNRNPLPAISLFNGRHAHKIDDNTYTLYFGNKNFPSALVEKGTNSDWIYYNNADKTKATVTSLLVHGDADFDLYDGQPIISVTDLEDGSLIFSAEDTIINGKTIFEATINRQFTLRGFTWAITSLSTPESSRATITVASNGFNQDGSSRKTGKIRIAFTDKPEEWTFIKDIDGDSELHLEKHADLVLSPDELIDDNTEWVRLTIHTANKTTLPTISMPLSSLLSKNFIENIQNSI